MKVFHTTTRDRAVLILKEGLRPGSLPTWFSNPAPYVMLAEAPWHDLNGEEGVVLEVNEPKIKPEYFEDPDGLRWPYSISPEKIRIL